MFGQKVIDEVFACLRPYITIRRIFLFIVISLLFSDSGVSLYDLDYTSLSFKEGVKEIWDALLESRFIVAAPVLWICFYFGPHSSHFLAMLSFKHNLKFNFIESKFQEAREKEKESGDVLFERVEKFNALTKRMNVLLETFTIVWMSALLYAIFNLLGYFIYIAPIGLVLLYLFYVEATSKVVREYAHSLYIVRLNEDGKE